MEEKKKILLLCGGKFAFKAMQLLAYEGFLCAVGIGKGSEVLIDTLEDNLKSQSLGFKSFSSKKDIQDMYDWIAELQPDYIFSIAFPFLIPQSVLAFGQEKFINFHAGALPQYRGVMPIFEVLKNQEKETAICAHFMNAEFDEGPIIFNDTIAIKSGETYGQLTVRMSQRVAQIALNVANMLQFATKIPSTPQEEKQAYYYQKPNVSDTFINWKRMNSSEIIALINACNPWNGGADAMLFGEQVKIISASIIDEIIENIMPGTIISDSNETFILVASADNKKIAIEIISTDYGIMTVAQMKSKNIYT
jgi:methionyl-tRNA formyltransferase